jgi:hypothetical protein
VSGCGRRWPADLNSDASLPITASLVHDGRLRNRTRAEHGVDLLEGRPVVTAIAIAPR